MGNTRFHPLVHTPSWSKLFHFYVVFGKNFDKQECIPVGCALSPAVAISGVGGLVSAGGGEHPP